MFPIEWVNTDPISIPSTCWTVTSCHINFPKYLDTNFRQISSWSKSTHCSLVGSHTRAFPYHQYRSGSKNSASHRAKKQIISCYTAAALTLRFTWVTGLHPEEQAASIDCAGWMTIWWWWQRLRRRSKTTHQKWHFWGLFRNRRRKKESFVQGLNPYRTTRMTKKKKPEVSSKDETT